MESALNPAPGSDIRGQAAEWLLARRQGLDPVRMQQFARWLASSPRHLAEYHAMERLGRDLPLVMAPARSVEKLVQDLHAADDAQGKVVPFTGHAGAHTLARRRSPAWALAAMFAFLAVGVVLLWPRMKGMVAPQVRELAYASAHGRMLQLSLEDGSVLTLDTDSEVLVRYGGKGRHVQLKSGRAMFEVVHDVNRPFEVTAGSAHVVDLGTKFDVYLKPDAVRVTVQEGMVEVSNQDVPGSRLLGPGQQIDVLPGQALATASMVNAEQTLGWSSGEILFDDMPLVGVVAEINRYAAKPIAIDASVPGGTTIRYSFRTSDVDAFLAFLRRSMGVRVEEGPDRIVVTSR